MKIIALTIAYCPAPLLARSLLLYKKFRHFRPDEHIIVHGHYPINERKNTNDINLIVDAFNYNENRTITLLDPGKNLGSAQSQNWALNQLNLSDEDYFINLDPDSACLTHDWDFKMKQVLDNDPNCMLISCMAPMVQRYLKTKNEELEIKGGTDARPVRWGIPKSPTPFNLSMWRYSFIKQIGGIPQLGLWWGETEAPFYAHCRVQGKYHAYLVDYMEDESGKFMQDKEQNEWKDLHMRTPDPHRFLGNFEEFLRWKYPALSGIDTCKDLENHNHP